MKELSPRTSVQMPTSDQHRKKRRRRKPVKQRRSKLEVAAAQRRATAFHEAGHAVAAHQLGFDLTEVHIIPDEDHQGMTKIGPRRSDDRWMFQNPLQGMADRLIRDFAGIVAEVKHTGRLQWRYGSNDFCNAFIMATTLLHTDDEAEAFLKYGWACTWSFLRRHDIWAAVCAVADALLECDRLSKDRVAGIIDVAKSAAIAKTPVVLVKRPIDLNDDWDRYYAWQVRRKLVRFRS